jgi:hypothetical protein
MLELAGSSTAFSFATRTQEYQRTMRAICVVISLFLAGPALAVSKVCDTTGLNIPQDRICRDGKSIWNEPITPPDTSGWTTVLMSTHMRAGGCRVNDGAGDDACLDAAMAAAKAAAPAKLYLENGTYDLGVSNNGYDFNVDSSNILIYGQSRNAILRFHNTSPGACGVSGMMTGSYTCVFDGSVSDTVNWTAGYSAGDTVVTVSDASAYATGDWVIARVYVNNSGCFEGGWVSGNSGLHIGKIACSDGEACDTGQLAANQFELDRPIRRSWDEDPECIAGGRTPDMRKFNGVLENVGFENLTIRHNTLTSGSNFKPLLTMQGVSNAWIRGVRFTNSFNRGLYTSASRDILIEGNRFDGIGHNYSNSNTTLFQRGATDYWVLNNVIEAGMGCFFYNTDGPSGGVAAYNYYVVVDSTNQRAATNHGAAGEMLMEGNDVARPMMQDNYWGRQFPRNTYYRNRMRGPDCSASRPHSYWSSALRHSDRDSLIADKTTLIANTGDWFMGGPNFPCGGDDLPVHDLDHSVGPRTPALTNLYMELNLATQRIALAEPLATTDCGSTGAPRGGGDCGTQGSRPQLRGRNYSGANAAPPEWGGVTIPTSLFLSSAPSWWCQEACPWSSEGIGALGDDMSRPAALCKIPAQIRYEGGSCTPLDGVPGPQIPAAPTLLD